MSRPAVVQVIALASKRCVLPKLRCDASGAKLGRHVGHALAKKPGSFKVTR